VESTLAVLDAAPERATEVRARYEAAALHLDREVLPRMVDAVTRGGGDALVAVTADHGEDFGDGRPDRPRFASIFDLHGRRLTDGTCRVPLVLWGSRVPPRPEGVGGLARGVDLPVTVLSLAGVAPVDDVDGADLSPCLATGDPCPSADALTVSPHNTFEEADVPRDPAALWRLWSLRTPDRRYVWDRATGDRRCLAFAADGEVDVNPEEAPADGWERIDELAEGAVPAPEEPDETGAVAASLRGLGYFA
jgi:arylsulfatase A-like enzyme